METHRIIILYNKIKQKTASIDEQEEFDVLLQDENAAQSLKMYWDQDWTVILAEDKSALHIQNEKEILNNILEHRQIEPKKIRNYKYMIAAASILILLAAGLFFMKQEYSLPSKQSNLVNVISPGKNTATLTLANGQKILLSDAADGELANQAGVKISKSKDGQIIYEIVAADTDSNEFNTLSTSNGETYRVRLPDQSEIWLNAASSIKYPVSFAKHTIRKVELKGEAYFEIAKDKKRPFVVESKNQQLRVLGTHFNVNAYDNESYVKTTLIEGSVNVQTFNLLGKGLETEQVTLKPGEQSILSDQLFKVQQADLEEAIAWKMGFFKFRDENIQSIMRKVSRWYNVEIIYKGEVPTSGLEGSVSRYQDITKLLDMLQSTGLVKFNIKGNKITVTK